MNEPTQVTRKAPKRRRWFQFSLRSLFVTTTLAAAFVAWRGEPMVHWIESLWTKGHATGKGQPVSAPADLSEALSDEEIRRIESSHIWWGPGFPPGIDVTKLRTRWDAIDCTEVPIIYPDGTPVIERIEPESYSPAASHE